MELVPIIAYGHIKPDKDEVLFKHRERESLDE